MLTLKRRVHSLFSTKTKVAGWGFSPLILSYVSLGVELIQVKWYYFSYPFQWSCSWFCVCLWYCNFLTGILNSHKDVWVYVKVQVCLCPTPWTIAQQALLSMEFSRQEYWSGLPFPSSGYLLTQELNPGLLHCKQILYHLSYQVISLLNWCFCRGRRTRTSYWAILLVLLSGISFSLVIPGFTFSFMLQVICN